MGTRTSFRYFKIADKIKENSNIDFSIGSWTTEILGGRVGKEVLGGRVGKESLDDRVGKEVLGGRVGKEVLGATVGKTRNKLHQRKGSIK